MSWLPRGWLWRPAQGIRIQIGVERGGGSRGREPTRHGCQVRGCDVFLTFRLFSGFFPTFVLKFCRGVLTVLERASCRLQGVRVATVCCPLGFAWVHEMSAWTHHTALITAGGFGWPPHSPINSHTHDTLTRTHPCGTHTKHLASHELHICRNYTFALIMVISVSPDLSCALCPPYPCHIMHSMHHTTSAHHQPHTAWSPLGPVAHLSSTSADRGWGCGWRNIQVHFVWASVCAGVHIPRGCPCLPLFVSCGHASLWNPRRRC